MSQNNQKCSRYTEDGDPEDGYPCKCPVCGGFLKWDPVTKEPICNNCQAELVAYPDVDEETKEPLEEGKICAISEPKRKLERAGNLKLKRQGKANAKAWKPFL